MNQLKAMKAGQMRYIIIPVIYISISDYIEYVFTIIYML